MKSDTRSRALASGSASALGSAQAMGLTLASGLASSKARWDLGSIGLQGKLMYVGSVAEEKQHWGTGKLESPVIDKPRGSRMDFLSLK